MMTSRGCPYRCHFCSSQSFWNKYQAKSPSKVIEEIKYLKSLGATEIIIFDDLFTTNTKRLEQIAKLIVEENLNELEYSCLVRSDRIDQHTIDLLKQINVKHLAFGAESGSNKMLAAMNKKTTVEDNQKAIDLLAENGLRPTMSFVVGYPGETIADLELTRQFIQKNRSVSDIIDCYPIIPFPGTKLWNWFIKHNSINSLDDFNWESLSLTLANINWDSYHMLTDYYSKEVLIDFIKWNESEKQLINERRLNASKIATEIKPGGLAKDMVQIIIPSSGLSYYRKMRDKFFPPSSWRRKVYDFLRNLLRPQRSPGSR